MAKLLCPGGKGIEVAPQAGSAFSVWELQKLVRGPLEVVDLGQGFLLVINPVLLTGKLNTPATKMANKEVRGSALLASRLEMGD